VKKGWNKMKRLLITVLMVSLFLVFVATAVAEEPQMTFDGKSFTFPGINPVNVSDLGFDLGNTPESKKFVIGKIFKFKFFFHTKKEGYKPVGQWYAVVTKLTENKIEVFFYPTNPKAPDEKPFLDCVPKCPFFGKCVPGINSTEYACEIRGRTAGNTYSMTFGKQKITIISRGGAEANSEVFGEILIPATADQKKP
jgi:hypothetical protein